MSSHDKEDEQSCFILLELRLKCQQDQDVDGEVSSSKAAEQQQTSHIIAHAKIPQLECSPPQEPFCILLLLSHDHAVGVLFVFHVMMLSFNTIESRKRLICSSCILVYLCLLSPSSLGLPTVL